MYNEVSNEVEIVVMKNETNIPSELCFQLVFGTTTADYNDAEGAQCVGVGEHIEINTGYSIKDAYLVGYGNKVFSEPSSLSTQTADYTGNASDGTGTTVCDFLSFALCLYYYPHHYVFWW